MDLFAICADHKYLEMCDNTVTFNHIKRLQMYEAEAHKADEMSGECAKQCAKRQQLMNEMDRDKPIAFDCTITF